MKVFYKSNGIKFINDVSFLAVEIIFDDGLKLKSITDIYIDTTQNADLTSAIINQGVIEAKRLGFSVDATDFINLQQL